MMDTEVPKGNDVFTILIVEDNAGLRKELHDGLHDFGHEVTSVPTGEAAIELVRRHPLKYDFALIDQVLVEGSGALDGITTAVEILKINREVGTIIYSGQIGLEDEALSQGVHRYLHKAKEELAEIQDYLREIRGLSDLQKRLGELHDKQEVLSSLTLSLNVGLALIDRKYRVWYVDERYKELVGKPQLQPALCYKIFHDYENGPCLNCPVKKAIKTGKRVENFFCNPFAQGQLKYIYTAADPVRNAKGQVIGAIKSMVELKEGPLLASLDLEAHRNLILRSLYERGHNEHRGYGRIRLFEIELQRSQWHWKCIYYSEGEKIISPTMETLDCHSEEIRSLETSGEESGFLPSPPSALSKKPLMYFWLRDQGKPKVLLLVDQVKSGYPLDQTDLPVVGDYAKALFRILSHSPNREKLPQRYKWEQEFDALRLRLTQAESPQQALSDLLEEVMRITGADMGHIRTVAPDQCLKVAFKGYYGDEAPKAIKAYLPNSRTAQVILSQQPLVINDLEEYIGVEREHLKLLFSLPPEHPLLYRIKSLLIQPLVYLGKCYGFVKLMSFKIGTFGNLPDERFHPLWQLLSYTLHDYSKHVEHQKLTEEILKRVNDERLELAKQAIHGVRSPAQAMGFYLHGLEKYLQGKKPLTTEKALEAITLATGQLARIDKLCSSFQRMVKPLSNRLETLDCREFLGKAVHALEQGLPGTMVEFGSEVVGDRIRLDCEAFLEALLELGRNAQKAVASQGRKSLKLQLTLRRPTPEELPGIEIPADNWVLLSFQDNGPGIPDKIRERLFQPWVSTDPSSSGLGLSIVRKVLADHGGSITLAVTGPQGATFHLIIPIQPQE